MKRGEELFKQTSAEQKLQFFNEIDQLMKQHNSSQQQREQQQVLDQQRQSQMQTLPAAGVDHEPKSPVNMAENNAGSKCATKLKRIITDTADVGGQ